MSNEKEKSIGDELRSIIKMATDQLKCFKKYHQFEYIIVEMLFVELQIVPSAE